MAWGKSRSRRYNKVKKRFSNIRHKELLERQHFGGPFWEGKEKPQSYGKKLPNYDPEKEMKEAGFERDIPEGLYESDMIPDENDDFFKSIKR